MLNSAQECSPSNDKSQLAQWLRRTLERGGVWVQFRLRGNHLHVLCESKPCISQAIALNRLLPALHQTDVNTFLPPDHPPIYQVLVHGRTLGENRPAWSDRIYLDQLDRHLEQLKQFRSHSSHARGARSARNATVTPAISTKAAPAMVDEGGVLVLSTRSQARRGRPEAIAQYLSESISNLGVAVKVSVKTLPYQVTVPTPELLNTVSVSMVSTRRLWIVCESLYSPDPLMIGEPVARQLRGLELEDFRDAVICIQVRGEAEPDWLLRVDLTPPIEMLRERARWGDVGAIAQLLQSALADRHIRLVTSALKDATLHLSFCQTHPDSVTATVPDRVEVRAIVAPLLDTLGPQGIHAATLYGQMNQGQMNQGQVVQAQGRPAQLVEPQAIDADVPMWIDWLDLPAAKHAALAEPALTLARQGDWDAIAFLLTCALNPDLNQQLATGGVRIQLLQRQDLLHIMTDAPVCPDQRQVSATMIKLLKQLRLTGVSGIRIYGRRAGQKRPFWSYGVDWISRHRLVPEPAPEFAATDAYVTDLVAQSSDDILRSDLTPDDLHNALAQFQQHLGHRLQTALVHSQLFALLPDQSLLASQAIAPATPSTHSNTAKVALIWGAIGLLLTAQGDRLLPYLQHSIPNRSVTQIVSPPVAAIPEPSPQSNIPISPVLSEDKTFLEETSPEDEVFLEEALPQTAKASVSATDSPFPTFNSQQLDEKVALYHQHWLDSGAPDVLIIGSSRALRGVDPAMLERELESLGYTDVSIFNYGVNGATAQVVDLLVRQLLTPEQLPRLIVWADGARAFNSSTVDVTYNGIVISEGYHEVLRTRPASAGATQVNGADPASIAGAEGLGASLTSSYREMDEWLSDRLATVSAAHAERDRIKAAVQQGLTGWLPTSTALTDPTQGGALGESQSLPNSGKEWMDIQGFLPLAVRFNPATYYQQYARVAGAYDSDYKDFQIEGKQAIALQNLLSYTRSHEIPVVFVNLPLTADYLDPVRLEHEQTFRQYMLNLSLTQQGLVFRDLGEMWSDRYPYFSDPSHLNQYGAQEVSRRLAQDPMIPWLQATDELLSVK